MTGDPCGPCGRCCRDFVVPLSGLDLWRLVRSQRLAPEDFTVSFPAKEPSAQSFILEPAGPHLLLGLDKRGAFAVGRPCVFLLELDGLSRCGVHADRPVVCRAYPMALTAGAIRRSPDAACPSGAFEGPAAFADWGPVLAEHSLAWEIHGRAAARWNARVHAAGARLPLSLFLALLVDLHDQLALRLGPGWALPPAGTTPGGLDARVARAAAAAEVVLRDRFPGLPETAPGAADAGTPTRSGANGPAR